MEHQHLAIPRESIRYNKSFVHSLYYFMFRFSSLGFFFVAFFLLLRLVLRFVYFMVFSHSWWFSSSVSIASRCFAELHLFNAHGATKETKQFSWFFVFLFMLFSATETTQEENNNFQIWKRIFRELWRRFRREKNKKK